MVLEGGGDAIFFEKNAISFLEKNTDRLFDMLQQLKQCVEPRVRNVLLQMLKRPGDGIHYQFELGLANQEERIEALGINGAQQGEKLDPVVGEILLVGRNHRQGGLKQGLENYGHVIGDLGP
jgi:hypothetical protein